MKYTIRVNTQSFDIEIGTISGDTAQVNVDGVDYTVAFETPIPAGAPSAPATAPIPPPSAAPIQSVPQPPPVAAGGEVVTAPIPGVILDIHVHVGDTVSPGQVLGIMEAMKMENNLVCHVAGTVTEIRVRQGSEVSTGDVVMIIG